MQWPGLDFGTGRMETPVCALYDSPADRPVTSTLPRVSLLIFEGDPFLASQLASSDRNQIRLRSAPYHAALSGCGE
jgi:hypothetical protein